jgi:TatD DNase family protein
MFFDSHCHLTDERLLADLPAVLERAESAQVSRILSISVDLEDTAKILTLTDGQSIFASAGVHPQQAKSWSELSDSRLRELAARPHVVALGECGLDYLYDESHPEYPGATRAQQEIVFEAQLQIASDLNLPVVIHNRHADERLLEIVAAWRDRLPRGGVFHCFGSRMEVAKRVLNCGFHLGFTGIVTFKNAEEIRDVVRLCPLDRMLVETDAPYLAPVPFRGKSNEPGYVPHVVAKIGEVLGKSREAVGESTYSNARTLFGI